MGEFTAIAIYSYSHRYKKQKYQQQQQTQHIVISGGIGSKYILVKKRYLFKRDMYEIHAVLLVHVRTLDRSPRAYDVPYTTPDARNIRRIYVRTVEAGHDRCIPSTQRLHSLYSTTYVIRIYEDGSTDELSVSNKSKSIK